MVNFTSSSSSSAPFTIFDMPPQLCVDRWAIAFGNDPRHSNFLESFRDLELLMELEPYNPRVSFFKVWDPIITELLRGPDLDSVKEIIETLWSLYTRFPDAGSQNRLASMIFESKDDLQAVLPRLGILLAHSRGNLTSTNPSAHLRNPSLTNSECFKNIIFEYFQSFRESLNYFINAIPGCTPAMKELATTTELGRMLAKALLNDRGRINKGTTTVLLNLITTQFSEIPELFKKQITRVLSALLKDPEFTDLLHSIGLPCPKIRADILLQLQYIKSHQMTVVDSREAALSALLTFPRQERSDCYVYASIIGLLQHDPKAILQNLKTMIENGVVMMPQLIGNQTIPIRLYTTYHCRYAGLSLTRRQIEESPPLRFAFQDLQLNFTRDQSDELITPREATYHLISNQAWTSEQIETAQRLTQNRISSFFQNHLLTSLCQHVRFFANNYLDQSKGVKRTLIDSFSSFSFLPVQQPVLKAALQPLSQGLRDCLEKRLFIEREDTFSRLLAISIETQIDLEELLNGVWGPLFDMSPGKKNPIYTWAELQDLLLELTVESLATLKRAQPQTDFSLQETAIAAWSAHKSEVELGLKEIAKSSAQMRGVKFPETLARSQFCLFSCSGGWNLIVLEKFFQKQVIYKSLQLPPSLQSQADSLKELHPIKQIYLLAQSLSTSIPANPNPDSPPLVLCTYSTAEGCHDFNLLPYNHSLKRMWTINRRVNDIATEIYDRGTVRSKQPLSPEQKTVLAELLQKKLPQNLLDEAIAPFGRIRETPEAIFELWQNNSKLHPFLDTLSKALESTCLGASRRAVLNPEQKSFIVQSLLTRLPPDRTLIDRACALLAPLDTTIELIEFRWSQDPFLAILTPFLKEALEPLSASWTSMKLTSDQKIQLMQSLPNQLVLDASICVLDPTAETLVAHWGNIPHLASKWSTLQISLNLAIEMVPWEKWEEIIQVFASLMQYDETIIPREQLHQYLLEANETERKNLSEANDFYGSYGMTLNHGASLLQKVLVKLKNTWEYNQFLTVLTEYFKFPNKILLADLNYENQKELWMGYQYGLDRVLYFTSTSDGKVMKITTDTSLVNLKILNGNNPQMNPLQRV